MNLAIILSEYPRPLSHSQFISTGIYLVASLSEVILHHIRFIKLVSCGHYVVTSLWLYYSASIDDILYFNRGSLFVH